MVSNTRLPQGQEKSEKLRKKKKVRKNFIKTSNFVSSNLPNSLYVFKSFRMVKT